MEGERKRHVAVLRWWWLLLGVQIHWMDVFCQREGHRSPKSAKNIPAGLKHPPINVNCVSHPDRESLVEETNTSFTVAPPGEAVFIFGLGRNQGGGVGGGTLCLSVASTYGFCMCTLKQERTQRSVLSTGL